MTQSAFDQSRYGIFTHYVPGLTIDATGRVPSTIDETADGFDAEGYAADVAAFGAQYVIFTAWHARMIPLYPSAVSDAYRPGTSARRDLIADLINALHRYDIDLLLYVHTTDGFELPAHDQLATGWNDASDHYRRWNDYVNSLITEAGTRYGTGVSGFWVDMIFEEVYRTKIDSPRLYRSLLTGNPRRTLIGNGGMDNQPVEISPGSGSRYSREAYLSGPITQWPAVANHTVTIATNANWWASVPAGRNVMHHTAEDLFRFTVLSAGVNTTGGGISWNVSPYVGRNLRWEDGLRETMIEVGGLVRAAGPSLTGVRPSRCYPTPAGSTLDDLPHGIVATEAADGLTTFLHVLNPPAARALTLPAPDCPVRFWSAHLLTGGAPVTVAQTEQTMTLTLISDDHWDPVDTVIALRR